MATASLIVQLLDLVAIAGGFWWLDRRAGRRAEILANGVDSIARELGLEALEPQAILEEEPPAAPPEPPTPCPVRRDMMRCQLEDGHPGLHESRTGVSWA